MNKRSPDLEDLIFLAAFAFIKHFDEILQCCPAKYLSYFYFTPLNPRSDISYYRKHIHQFDVQIVQPFLFLALVLVFIYIGIFSITVRHNYILIKIDCSNDDGQVRFAARLNCGPI